MIHDWLIACISDEIKAFCLNKVFYASADTSLCYPTQFMNTTKNVRAGEFQPHADDMDAMAQMSGLRGRFQLNPRGQVYHLWLGERLADEHIRLFAAFPNLISVSAGVSWIKFEEFTHDGAIELAKLSRIVCCRAKWFCKSFQP